MYAIHGDYKRVMFIQGKTLSILQALLSTGALSFFFLSLYVCISLQSVELINVQFRRQFCDIQNKQNKF